MDQFTINLPYTSTMDPSWDMISPIFRYMGRGTESHATPPAGAGRIHPRQHQGEAHGTFHADGAWTVAWRRGPGSIGNINEHL